jgi:UDP-N-acetylmuramyl pentapeptide phosphotransferase/UDP-N-acetylglucosamine-1-phosphate transferase
MKDTSHWLDDPRNVKKLWRGFLAILALTVAAGALIDLHPHFEIERWFGFHAAYGFLACLLMIVGAKALGLLLKKPDTYYAKDARDE